jgi:hypothetical protein
MRERNIIYKRERLSKEIGEREREREKERESESE